MANLFGPHPDVMRNPEKVAKCPKQNLSNGCVSVHRTDVLLYMDTKQALIMPISNNGDWRVATKIPFPELLTGKLRFT